MSLFFFIKVLFYVVSTNLRQSFYAHLISLIKSFECSLIKMNVSTQLGMAIYKGLIDLEDAFCIALDFQKQTPNP